MTKKIFSGKKNKKKKLVTKTALNFFWHFTQKIIP